MAEGTELSPQLKYMRKMRADPNSRLAENLRQQVRRKTPEYRAKAQRYFKEYRWQKKWGLR